MYRELSLPLGLGATATATVPIATHGPPVFLILCLIAIFMSLIGGFFFLRSLLRQGRTKTNKFGS